MSPQIGLILGHYFDVNSILSFSFISIFDENSWVSGIWSFIVSYNTLEQNGNKKDEKELKLKLEHRQARLTICRIETFHPLLQQMKPEGSGFKKRWKGALNALPNIFVKQKYST